MLVLGRKEREAIVIQTKDGPVVVQVVRVYENRVVLGFEAPKQVKILRGELKERAA